MELIDKEALLRAYDAEHKGPAGRARTLIEETPTVDAEPIRHGEWIYCEYSRGRYIGTCSLCGYERKTDKYCPHCGAKMDGERKEE